MAFPAAEEGEEGGDQFFDTREDLSSVSSSCPISPMTPSVGLDASPPAWASSDLLKVWMARPVPDISVWERRSEFRKWMGLTPVCSPRVDSIDLTEEATRAGRESSPAAVTGNSSRERRTPSAASPLFLTSSESGNISSSISSWTTEEGQSSSKDIGVSEGSSHLGERIAAALASDASGKFGSFREYHDDDDVLDVAIADANESHKASVPVSFLRRMRLRREDNRSTSSSSTSTSSEEPVSRRSRWLKKLGAVACLAHTHGDDDTSGFSGSDHRATEDAYRVKVHSHKKKSKEFSAVYMVQSFQAHEGAIWTMKFSHDGRYLATGGEDGIVRVWLVEESKCAGGDYILAGDAARRFGSQKNHLLTKKGMKRLADPAIVVIPSKVFKLSEKPVHEFHGHCGDILDISWSSNKYFVTSSLDKTVRLWQLGCNSCLKVFSHTDYVTCVQFNPIDENYCISGCIDGKIRVWDISAGCVVDWSDTRDIVTAVCFQPDGKGLVVGSMGGNCRFYSISDNQLQLEHEISLHSKKKSSCKRITGFQFCSSNPKKLLVTSADSQIRVFDNYTVVNKFKGFQNAGSQICASFTKDGRHILSASEDSNVYIWSYVNQDGSLKQAKNLRSYEHFFSSEVSIAIPWVGFTPHSDSQKMSTLSTSKVVSTGDPGNQIDLGSQMESDNDSLCLSSCGNLSTARGFLIDVLNKGSATWPEEKLPPNRTTAEAAICKSQYEFVKNSIQKTAATPHSWGQVIVTAGLDGRIRSFQNYGLPIHV